MSTHANGESLQDLLDRRPDIVDYFTNDSPGLNTRGNIGRFPIPPEFTNWRDEQKAWRETAILFNQTHHMPEMFVTGPDARRLLNWIGVNSLANLEPGRAKQFIGCTPEGYLIGDCILYMHGDESYELVSSMPLLNWIEYQVSVGDWNVALMRDNNTAERTTPGRVRFRYQLDGPRATSILEAAVGRAIPDVGPFRTFTTSIADVKVLVLRHGMAGRHRAYEISGEYAHDAVVHEALLSAGEEFGLLQGGLKTYYSTSQESGWMAGPLPAIYTDAALREYREWLPANSWEGRWQLAGSFHSDRIEDYYVTPFELGYGKIVKFDHDFIGRDALERMSRSAARQRVTLIWNRDDVLSIMGTLLEDGVPAKYIELPTADYATLGQRDRVLIDDQLVGLSIFCGYSANERRFLSLAMVDPAQAEPGTEVVVLWGEPNGGSRKPGVERHRQVKVRATVAPAPFAYSPQSTGSDLELTR